MTLDGWKLLRCSSGNVWDTLGKPDGSPWECLGQNHWEWATAHQCECLHGQGTTNVLANKDVQIVNAECTLCCDVHSAAMYTASYMVKRLSGNPSAFSKCGSQWTHQAEDKESWQCFHERRRNQYSRGCLSHTWFGLKKHLPKSSLSTSPARAD